MNTKNKKFPHRLKYIFHVFLCVWMLSNLPQAQGGFTADAPMVREPAPQEEIFQDWLLQDLAFDPAVGQQPVNPNSPAMTVFTEKAPGTQNAELERKLVQKVLDDIQKFFADADSAKVKAAESVSEVQKKCEGFKAELAALNAPGTDARWRDLYSRAASLRRDLRLAVVKQEVPKFIFTKHYNLGGSHYAYTEGLSDAQAERHFIPGTQLCTLELGSDGKYTEKVLINDSRGVIRDPDVTFDGKKLVFAWKKSNRLDDYHLYQMELDSKNVKQLTFGLGYADYEPCCLPSGDIIFNSTRCSQIVDCWWTEVSNLYRMDAEGKYMRRMTFDQVHDNYPVCTHDGRIIYTRWDYVDRGQIYPQGLFQMNPDGTGQTALYGNNSWFPTTILHTRSIPNTNGKLLCVFSGHHTRQRGKLGVLDPNKGREEADGAQLVAPIRETEPVHVDAYGQLGDQYCYPMPITETEFLVAYRPNADLPEFKQGTGNPFKIYFMDMDGNRELLISDPVLSCNQMAFLKKPNVQERPSMVDAAQETGVYYLQDVFYGPGLEGVDKSEVRSLRVVSPGFRSVGVGSNGNSGPAGGAMVSTPIAIGGGTWDTKTVLGEAKIYEDGSACFRVPARTPVYFQVLNQDGHVIQTMRSWSTLQPGETFSCIGCHEDKNSIAARGSSSLAMKAGPQDLKPFYGPPRGFSFQKEIQPILDKHCVRCHDNSDALPPYSEAKTAAAEAAGPETDIPAGELEVLLPVRSAWSYLTEKEQFFEVLKESKVEIPAENADLSSLSLAKGWSTQYPLKGCGPMAKGPFGVIPKPEYVHGASWNTSEIWLTTELNLPENYVPRPLCLNVFHDEDIKVFINGQLVLDEKFFLTQYEQRKVMRNPLKPGRNVVAVYCRHTAGGQGVDLGISQMKNGEVVKDLEISDHPFSLKDRPWEDVKAKRFWSEAYMNLTNSPYVERTSGKKSHVVNWINIQESPQMLKPYYYAGAAKSSLCFMFNEPNPHNGVVLSQKEKELIACWIDLLVPFCGDYETASAWNEADKAFYAKYMKKRDFMYNLESENYQAWAKNEPQNVIVNSENPFRCLASEAEKTEAEKEVTFKFPTPVRIDQIRVKLSADAQSNESFQFQIGGVQDSANLSKDVPSGCVFFNEITTQEVRVKGNAKALEKLEILGVKGT